jgi:hypothetical protein
LRCLYAVSAGLLGVVESFVGRAQDVLELLVCSARFGDADAYGYRELSSGAGDGARARDFFGGAAAIFILQN